MPGSLSGENGEESTIGPSAKENYSPSLTYQAAIRDTQSSLALKGGQWFEEGEGTVILDQAG